MFSSTRSKILFPDADYYVHRLEFDRTASHRKYNIEPKFDWSSITDKNYDCLFICIALYNVKKGTPFFSQEIHDIFEKEKAIINNNNFKKVCLFDNFDYDYDPNTIVNDDDIKIDMFFKRYYNKTKKYQINVVPFPFIMFGEMSIIEKLEAVGKPAPAPANRIFFTGTLFNHYDPQLNYGRNRAAIYNKISRYIYNPGKMGYHQFLQEIAGSKYSLDLNGVGDPNKRTFEILSQGSLMIREYNPLKWPFDEEFSEETVFKNEIDFVEKIRRLEADSALYSKCLENQNHIFQKYFNKDWIRNYIIQHITN